MDRGNGAFFALVALPRIHNLRAVNIVISSTPAASTTVIFNNLVKIIATKTNLLAIIDFRTWVPLQQRSELFFSRAKDSVS
jgi:hypothetical protein